MIVPLTPKSTRKAEDLVRVSPTIDSCREEDDTLRKWTFPRYTCVRYILETKTKVGITTVKAPDPRINPNIDETPTVPKSQYYHKPTHRTKAMGEHTTQRRRPPHRRPNRHSKGKSSSGHHRTWSHVVKKTRRSLRGGSGHCHGTVSTVTFLKLKQKSEGPQRNVRTYVPPTRKSVRHPPYPNHTPTHPTPETPPHQPRLRFYILSRCRSGLWFDSSGNLLFIMNR
jgi:hypothetical protein